MKTLATLAGLLITTSALAFTEPDGFRGIPWGGRETSLRSRPGWRLCEDLNRVRQVPLHGTSRTAILWPEIDRGDRRCVETFMFPGMRATDRAEAEYFFRTKGGLQWVLVRFNARYFEEIRQLFTEQHGREAGSSTFGPGFLKQNVVVEWAGPQTTILMVRYGTDADSFLFLGPPQEIDREMQRWQAGASWVVPRVQR